MFVDNDDLFGDDAMAAVAELDDIAEDTPAATDVLAEVTRVVDEAQALPEQERLQHVTGSLKDVLHSTTPDQELWVVSVLAGSKIMGKTDAQSFVKGCIKAGKLKAKEAAEQARLQRQQEIEQRKAANTALMGGDTWPYTVAGGALCIMTENTFTNEIDETPIANFDVSIVSQLVDEWGNRHYTVKGTTVSGHTFETEISASQFSDAQKLKAALEVAAGPRDPVHARMAEHLGPAIKLLSNGNIETRHLRNHTGWDGNKFLIPGREPEETEIRVDSKAYYHVAPGGDLDDGVKALRSLMNVLPKQKTTVLLSAIMGPVAAQALGVKENKYALFSRGVTGSQKTTITRLFMAIYGDGILQDGNVLGFGNKSTVNALMYVAAQCGDLPFMVDNWKPNTTRNGDKDFYVLAHGILEGGDKMRMGRYGSGLQESLPIEAWPIFTGEDLPSGDAATVARTLTLLFVKREGAVLPELSEAQQHAEKLPIIGNAWIEWLESADGQLAAQTLGQTLNDKRSEWLRYLIANRPQMVNPHRVATNLAINELMYALVCQSPFGGFLADYTADHIDGLRRCALDAGDFTGGGSEAQRFVEALRELLSTGRAVLAHSVAHHDAMTMADKERLIGWVGTKDGDTVTSAYIYPTLAMNMVTRLTGDDFNGLTRYAILQQLDSLGWLAGRDRDRLEKSSKISGKKERYIYLNDVALNGTDTDDESVLEAAAQVEKAEADKYQQMVDAMRKERGLTDDDMSQPLQSPNAVWAGSLEI